MFILKKHLFVTMLCLLFIISYVHYLPAEEETGGEQKTESKEKGSPSFSISGTNLTITPAVKPAGQKETQSSGKNASPGGDQPHLTIDALDYNVGEVWEGEDMIHTFTIKNTGTAQLDISNVKAG